MNAQKHGELANFIWGICNLLRGPYTRNEYRKVILPLTALRRFDCVLAETKEAVLAADKGYGAPTRFSGQFTCRHHAASAAAAGLLSYSTGLRSPIEV